MYKGFLEQHIFIQLNKRFPVVKEADDSTL
jgi:hypothetical protein